MNKAVIAAIVVVTAIMLFWYFKSEQPYQPIVEDPHPQVDSLFNLMDQALRTRQYHEGANLARQALEISQKDRYRYGEVNSLIALGFVLTHEAKYDSAIIMLEKARELVFRYRLDPEQRHRAGSFLAESYQAVGRIDKALECLNEGVEYFRAHDKPLQLCATYNNLGLLYQSQGMYEQAEKIYTEGLAIAKTIPDDRYYERSFTGNLGILYAIVGKLDDAIPLIETSLRMGREMNDPVAQGIDHQYLGSIQFARGNFREALKHYLNNARLMERAGENHNLIRAYRNIAKVYDALNDIENAEIYYRKAVEVVDTKLEGKYEQFPQVYLFYAVHKIRQGDNEQADKLLKKAITGYSSLKAPKGLAACYLAQTELEHDRGEFDRGLEKARAAFGLYQKIGAGPADRAEAHLWLALTHHALAHEDSALSHFNEAIALSQHTDDSDIAWRAHHHFSRFHSQKGDLETAAEHARQAVAAIEKLRRYTISPEHGSLFLDDKVEVYQHYFEVLFRQYIKAPSDDQVGKLFALSEQTRGRALIDNLKTGMQSVFSQLQQSTSLQNLEEQIVSVNQFIREELNKPKEEQRDGLIKKWRQQLTVLQQDYKLLSTQFVVTYPELATLLSAEQIEVVDIQENLPASAALISFLASADNLWAMVIDSSRINVKKLSVHPNLLWQKIKALRKPFQEIKEGKVDFLRAKFDAELSHELYRQLIAPLSDFTTGFTRWIIVPTGALHYLPFELLVTGMKGPRYLLERFTLSYLPSAALLPLLSGKNRIKTQQTLLAFGNPIYQQTESEPAQLAAVSFSSRLRNLLFTPLPSASLEVQEIADIFDSATVSVLSEGDATESAYKQRAGQYRFIHFATHGYVDEQNQNFSALLLNPGAAQEDGLLYAFEIYTTPIQAELVSMSACETALGEYRKSEGLVSLVQAFFAAGSQSVLASLWSVEEAAYPLVVSFYRNIQNGMPKVEALRQAKLEFISGTAESGEVAYSQSHPFLWAPFVLYGVQ